MKRRAKCPKCGEVVDEDLNELGVQMWARFGPPMCLSGCRVRMEEQGIVTQLGPGERAMVILEE